jgi:acyl transferase domain-containing protein/acyl carrier protein
MEPILPELRALLSQVELSAPRLELPSNVSGLVEPAAFATPDYWLEQLRRPVQFERMIRTLHQSGYDFFIEVGPHPALISMARQSIDDARVTWQPTLRQRFSDWQRLGEVLMRLHALGTPIDWLAFDADYRRERVRLPSSVFEPRRLWLEAAPASSPAPLADAGPTPSPGPLAQLFEAGDLAGLRAELERDGLHLNGSAPETLRAFDALFSLQHRNTRERALSSMVFATEWQLASPDACRADPAGAGPGLWLVLADRGGLAEGLAERLRRRGDQCVLLSRAEQGPTVSLGPDAWQICSHESESLPELSAALRARLGSAELRGIVSLWPLDERASDLHAEQVVAECVAHLFITRLAEALAPSASRVLWWVTRQAQSVAGSVSEPHSLVGAALWGLGRALSLERPELWGGLVDLGESNDALEFSELCAILDAKPAEDQLALRGRSRFVPRLVARPLEQAPPLALGNRGAYVISGGLGALGRDAARWLASRGAQQLALFSRNAPDSAAQQAIAALESMGARVSVQRVDVADPEALAAALAAVRELAGGIAGVIHAAGVLGYQPLETLDLAAFQSVLAAKVSGGWNLHRFTQEDELEFFVSYSSVSALWGSKGQAHYAAANAFLDGLSRFRAATGLPATAIQWGPWSGGGMTRADAAALYAGIGMHSLVPRASTELLSTLLAGGSIEYAVADIDWPTFVTVLSGRRPRPFFERVSAAQTASGGELAGAASAAFLQRLAALPRDEQLEFLRSLVAAAAGKCLGMPAQELDPSRGFFALGMDSIMAVEMVEALRKETGLKLSYATLFEHVSVEQLAQHLLSVLLPAPLPMPEASDLIAKDEANESARITAQVLELDDEELRSYINAEVDSILNGK